MKMLEFQHEQRMRELEAEQQHVLYCLQAMAMQQSMLQQGILQQNAQYADTKPSLWQGALANSLPNLLNMGSVVLNNVTKKQPQLTLPKKTVRQLMLTDGSDRK